MTKQELTQKVAVDAGIAGGQAKSAVDAAFDAIASELAAGRDVVLAGFGKFSVSERAARDGRNPASGETIQIAASTVAKFSAAAALKSSSTAERGSPPLLSYEWRGPGPMTGRCRAGPRRGASISRPAAVIFHARAEPAATRTRPRA